MRQHRAPWRRRASSSCATNGGVPESEVGIGVRLMAGPAEDVDGRGQTGSDRSGGVGRGHPCRLVTHGLVGGHLPWPTALDQPPHARIRHPPRAAPAEWVLPAAHHAAGGYLTRTNGPGPFRRDRAAIVGSPVGHRGERRRASRRVPRPVDDWCGSRRSQATWRSTRLAGHAQPRSAAPAEPCDRAYPAVR